MYELIKQEGTARRAAFHTVHGTVQTPAFQNVATCGAIKGALSANDLKEIGVQYVAGGSAANTVTATAILGHLARAVAVAHHEGDKSC